MEDKKEIYQNYIHKHYIKVPEQCQCRNKKLALSKNNRVKNLGYCFVMMAKPKYVIDFYKVFNGRIFGKKKCKKPCNVIWADVQGEDFLKECEDNPIRKPIIFKDIKTD